MNPERDKQAPLTGIRVSVFAFSSCSSFNLAHPDPDGGCIYV